MTAEKTDGYSPRQLAADDNEVMKVSMQAKSTHIKSARDASDSGDVARTKSAPATRNDAQPAEPEDDAFDRAIAKALKSGDLDDMIAEALQEERDGKTMPL